MTTAIEKNKRLSAADADKLGAKLEKEYAKGKSLAELAGEHGTSAGRVRGLLLSRGVALRPRGGDRRSGDPTRAKLGADIRKEYEKGSSAKQIAESRGMPVTTVYAYLRRAGTQLRRRGPAAG